MHGNPLQGAHTISVPVVTVWRANLLDSAPLADLRLGFVLDTVDELDEMIGGDCMLKGVVEPDGLAGDLAYIE